MIVINSPIKQQQIEGILLKEYEISPRRIEAYGKVKKVESNRGTFAFKRTNISGAKITNLQLYFDFFQNESFQHTIPYTPNKFGDLFLTDDSCTYYVTPWIEDDVNAKYSNDWESEVLSTLGRMHKLSVIHRPLHQVSHRMIKGQLKRWKHRQNKLNEYIDFAHSRPLLSPFESSVLNHYERISHMMSKAMTYLEEWMAKWGEETEGRFVLCHGHLSRSHVLKEQDTLTFINFDYSVIDFPVRDLVIFFRRHLHLSTDWSLQLVTQWLEAYEQQMPLSRAEKLLFAIYLLFPEHLMREIELYYSKDSKHIHPIVSYRQFEKKIELTQTLRQFVKHMLYS